MVSNDSTNPLHIDQSGIINLIDSLASRTGDSFIAESLRESTKKLVRSGLPNLSILLPALLNLKGKPYTLGAHFPFEPFFNSMMSKNVILKTGRQVSKSTSLAAQGVIISNCIPFFNTLYVTPLYEMIRRFSNNYVRGFIEQSPLRRAWTSSTTSGNVLQRSFVNHSSMFFSFAFLDADRTRGLNCDKVAYDEVQDLDSDFIPIIRETMSASPWTISQYAGTPKSLDNTIERLWQDSSMAEWVIRCGCGKDNIPALDHDLAEMIGPLRADISVNNPACICANKKCRKPIDPRTGRWWHRRPDLIPDFSGYHVPQIIMPMHYGDPDKWQILLGKQQGAFNTPANVFYNEVCGESYDTGSKLVSMTDLKKAAVLNEKTLPKALEHAKKAQYTHRILAIDWGGGGAEKVSFTVYAVLGMRADGKIEVIYGYRSLTPHDETREALIALQLMGKFQCTHIAHDYTGAGKLREKFIVDAGVPLERIISCWYVPAASQGIMRYVPASENHPRDHYKMDKSASLALTCNQIKQGGILFFQYDHKGKDNAGLLHDFLALTEEHSNSNFGRDRYMIIRQDKQTDDFAQAVNIGVCSLYYKSQWWPNLAEMAKYRVDRDVLSAVDLGEKDPDWGTKF
jgi:hypothetical protein